MSASHGTYARYRYEYDHGEDPCAECLKANRDYHRAYRAKLTKEQRAIRSRRNGARSRALWRLVALHPEEFAALTLEELAR